MRQKEKFLVETLKVSLLGVWQRITWQRIPSKDIVCKSPKQETVFLIGYAFLYILFSYATGILILAYPMPILGAVKFNQDVWYTFVYKILLLLVIPGWVFFKKWGYTMNDLLLGWKLSLKSGALLAISFTLGFLLNVRHLSGIAKAVPGFSDANIRLAMGVVTPLLMAGIPEELFYRYFLQTRLEKQWGRLAALFLATLLFTLWHIPSRFLLSTGVEGQAGNFWSVAINTGIPVFVAGFIVALLWDRYRNILILIAFHWGGDILPALSSYFKISF